MTERTQAPKPDSARQQLLARWQEARRRRHEAALGSEEWRKASEDVARIEIEVARVERAMDPPLG